MRYTLLIAIIVLFFTACKKDKYTTAPQISYRSVKPNAINSSSTSDATPVITFRLTDAEGDIGDTAYIYLKNILTGKSDSLPFPTIPAKHDFKGDISVTIDKVLDCKHQPGNVVHTDQLFFEIYVKDFAKNKSNVITTGDPVYFTCQ